MQVYTNLAALNTARMLNRTDSSVSTTLQRLSSGARINSARDDAAGLAITERMTSEIRGLSQGMRNVNDGVSLLQTAEGGLEEIGNMIQRMRELAVQAANEAVMSDANKANLQKEVDQLLGEINRIAETTAFNGISILNDNVRFDGADTGSDEMKAQIALRDVWLQQSTDRISTFFGMDSSNIDITVDFEDPTTDGVGGTLAFVSAGVLPGVGNISNLELNIDMADFANVSTPNGGTAPFYYDRIIAHEMVHAVMYDQTDTTQIQTWFLEGAAEFIHGADERVNGDAAAAAIGANKAAGLAALVNLDVVTGAAGWGGGSVDYSVGYLAVRYLHDIAAGGITGVMNQLEGGASLQAAIAATTGHATLAAFQTDFRANVGTVVTDGDLSNADTGAVGGLDADAGASLDANSVINNTEVTQSNPTNFNVVFPLEFYSNEGPTQYLDFQIGSKEGETIKVAYAAASTKSLGITNVDLRKEASTAITKLDNAITYVSKQRARLGAQQNRLESALSVNEVAVESLSASRSRIKDADYAVETAELTKSQILQQAATAMMSQAQANSNLALQLLSQF